MVEFEDTRDANFLLRKGSYYITGHGWIRAVAQAHTRLSRDLREPRSQRQLELENDWDKLDRFLDEVDSTTTPDVLPWLPDPFLLQELQNQQLWLHHQSDLIHQLQTRVKQLEKK